MTPRKPKIFIKPTAEAVGQSESLVDDVVNFYWSNVRKALSELESPSITITNLGVFKVRYKQIAKLEKKYQNYIDGMLPERMTFNKHTLQNNSKIKLDNLASIKKKMEAEFERKRLVKIKRQEYVNNKSLEEQREDSRRDQE